MNWIKNSPDVQLQFSTDEDQAYTSANEKQAETRPCV